MSKAKATTPATPIQQVPASPNGNTAVRYSINLHDTLAQEKQVSNGKESPYFVVVKNVPFIIVISSKSETPTNFKKNAITACLLYDCAPRREVSLIRSSPLEYVTHVSSNGEEITIEARIHVLTSQHEDSLFRVSVSFNNQEVTSDPLKVISKADNIRKPSKNSNTTSTIKKKRTASDAFGDTLSRIEQQQQEQRKLIDLLCQQNSLLMDQLRQASSSSTSNPSSATPVPSSSSDATSASSPCKLLDIDTAFSQFINCYASLCPSERPLKVRALRKATEHNDSLMAEFTNNFIAQPPTMLDEVLVLGPHDFLCVEPELTQFVPASPLPLSSPSSLDMDSPLASPDHDEFLDGYWSSLSHSETNSPQYDYYNDYVDISTDVTDNFIAELLLPNSSSDCTSSC